MKPLLVHINHTIMIVSELVDKSIQRHPEHADAVTQFLARIYQSREDLRSRIYDTETPMQESSDGTNAPS